MEKKRNTKYKKARTPERIRKQHNAIISYYVKKRAEEKKNNDKNLPKS